MYGRSTLRPMSATNDPLKRLHAFVLKIASAFETPPLQPLVIPSAARDLLCLSHLWVTALAATKLCHKKKKGALAPEVP
jgi:hypothetical protein